jgi:hypothetical protein
MTRTQIHDILVGRGWERVGFGEFWAGYKFGDVILEVEWNAAGYRASLSATSKQWAELNLTAAVRLDNIDRVMDLVAHVQRFVNDGL